MSQPQYVNLPFFSVVHLDLERCGVYVDPRQRPQQTAGHPKDTRHDPHRQHEPVRCVVFDHQISWYPVIQWINGSHDLVAIFRTDTLPHRPYHNSLQFIGRSFARPACITARASRTCRDACRDRLPTAAGKKFPAFPAHAILRIWQEAHGNGQWDLLIATMHHFTKFHVDIRNPYIVRAITLTLGPSQFFKFKIILLPQCTWHIISI